MYLPSSTQGSFCKFTCAFEIVFGFPPSEWLSGVTLAWSLSDWGANEERGIGRTTFGAPRGRKERCLFWVDLEHFWRLVLKMTFRPLRGAFFFFLLSSSLLMLATTSLVKSLFIMATSEVLGLGRVGRSRLGVSQLVAGTPKLSSDFWGDSFCWGGSWRPGFCFGRDVFIRSKFWTFNQWCLCLLHFFAVFAGYFLGFSFQETKKTAQKQLEQV